MKSLERNRSFNAPSKHLPLDELLDRVEVFLRQLEVYHADPALVVQEFAQDLISWHLRCDFLEAQRSGAGNRQHNSTLSIEKSSIRYFLLTPQKREIRYALSGRRRRIEDSALNSNGIKEFSDDLLIGDGILPQKRVEIFDSLVRG